MKFKREGKFIYFIGFFISAIGFLLMFTPEELKEIKQLMENYQEGKK